MARKKQAQEQLAAELKAEKKRIKDEVLKISAIVSSVK